MFKDELHLTSLCAEKITNSTLLNPEPLHTKYHQSITVTATHRAQWSIHIDQTHQLADDPQLLCVDEIFIKGAVCSNGE